MFTTTKVLCVCDYYYYFDYCELRPKINSVKLNSSQQSSVNVKKILAACHATADNYINVCVGFNTTKASFYSK